MPAGDTFVTLDWERVTLESGVPGLLSLGVSMGRVARFCGNCDSFYSVLAHAMTVAEIMPAELGIYGLLHDCSETVFSDQPTPMKMAETRVHEKAFFDRLLAKHGIRPLDPWTSEVLHEADYAALKVEAHAIGYKGAQEFWPHPDLLDWTVPSEMDRKARTITDYYLTIKPQLWLDMEYTGPLFTQKFYEYYYKHKIHVG